MADITHRYKLLQKKQLETPPLSPSKTSEKAFQTAVPMLNFVRMKKQKKEQREKEIQKQKLVDSKWKQS